jgi:hypothetical protein
MNASELENIWKKQPAFTPSRESIAQIAATVCSADRKFRQRIWWRDAIEIAVAVALAGGFALLGRTWLRWISITSVLFVAAYLVRSRISREPIRKTLNVTEQLEQMIRDTEKQMHLLRSIAWWYLLPCSVAAVAIALDGLQRQVNLSHLLTFGGVFVPLYTAIYWLNQRAVRRLLQPRRANLQNALSELRQQS